MGSYQGFMGRKLAVEIGQVMAMAVATSSTPSPSEDGTYLVSPYESKSQIKPMMAITIVFAFVGSVLLGLLLLHLQPCYTRLVLAPSHGSQSTPPQGLDGNFLETLPKLIFSLSSSTHSSLQDMTMEEKKKKKKKGLMECSICLEEFEDGETLRLLPQCGHAFHISCIDMWLFSHTNCPLCRHSLLQLPLDPPQGGGGGNGNSGDGAAIARSC